MRATPPVDLYSAALLLLIAASVVFLFLAPTVGALTWVERRVARRIAAATAGGEGAGRARWTKVLADEAVIVGAGDRLLVRLAPYFVFAAVSACVVALPFGQYLVAADLDVGVLYVIAVTSLVTVGLVSGGWAASGKGSVLGGVRAAAQIVSYEVPGALAVACIVMMTGSLRLQEIIRAQGGWPWDWYAFKSPVTVALFFLYFATVLALGGGPRSALPEAEGGENPAPQSGGSGRYALFVLAQRANVFVTGAVAAALFLGGWQVPGLSAGAQEAHVGLQALGALVFLAKAWGLMVAAVWVRAELPELRDGQRMALCWKWLVPAAFASFVLSAAWVAWSPGRTAQLVMGAGMFALACVAAVRFGRRVVFALHGGGADLRLNPFL
jgi:NADH-quinone oxidoreductase subunit H